jgi:hypothetical protein
MKFGWHCLFIKNLKELCVNLEDSFQNTIDSCIPIEWEEDTITLKIISAMWKQYQTTLISHRGTLQINWQPYKLKKTQSLEQRFGDIAILVNILFSDGTSSRGAGFLEAKKRNLDSRKFDAIKQKQFQRILTHAPHAQVLLYDNMAIKNFSDLGFSNPRSHNPLAAQIPRTKSITSPMNYVHTNNLNDEKIYNTSLPFSYQLCYRYFQGFDLEYDDAYSSILQGIKPFSEKMNERGFPQYLMIFSVSYGRFPYDGVAKISISPEHYEKIQ